METKRIVSIFSRAINKNVDVFLTTGGQTITGKLLQYTIDGVCIQRSDQLKEIVLIPKQTIKIVVVAKSPDDK